MKTHSALWELGNDHLWSSDFKRMHCSTLLCVAGWYRISNGLIAFEWVGGIVRGARSRIFLSSVCG